MIFKGIDNNSLLNVYPSIAGYYPTGQTTFDIQITEALRQIVRELKKNRKSLTKYLGIQVILALQRLDEACPSLFSRC